jgi:TRAP-type C4-dicarboxylate transport system substrate-binding protein
MPEPPLPAEIGSPPGAIVLKAMTFLPLRHTSNSGFYWFIDTINKQAHGELVIKFLGGAEAMSPLKQTQVLRVGDFDLSLLPPSYYEKEVPEVVAFALTRNIPWDQRKNGFYALMVELMERLNVRFLGRTASPGNSYNIYTNVSVNDPRTDFKRLKIRSSATYDRFLDALGCTKVNVGREDQYKAMKEGVMDGYVLTPNIRGYGMHEVTKYRIEPSFYDSDIGIYANLNTWRRLPRHLQELVEKAVAEQERVFAPKWLEMAQNEFAFQAQAGIKTIPFSKEDTEWFVDLAYQTGWERVFNEAPNHGPRLRGLSK